MEEGRVGVGIDGKGVSVCSFKAGVLQLHYKRIAFASCESSDLRQSMLLIGPLEEKEFRPSSATLRLKRLF